MGAVNQISSSAMREWTARQTRDLRNEQLEAFERMEPTQIPYSGRGKFQSFKAREATQCDGCGAWSITPDCDYCGRGK